MGDGRKYDWVVSLRAVETIDFMTAHWAHLPYEFRAASLTALLMRSTAFPAWFTISPASRQRRSSGNDLTSGLSGVYNEVTEARLIAGFLSRGAR